LEKSHAVDYKTWCAAPPLADLYERYSAAAGAPAPAPRDKLLGHQQHRPWGQPPLGITVLPDGKRVRDEAGLQVIDLIFKLRSEGWSTRSIATHLDANGYRGRRGGAWTGGKVSWVLRHPSTYYSAEVDAPAGEPTPRKPPTSVQMTLNFEGGESREAV